MTQASPDLKLIPVTYDIDEYADMAKLTAIYPEVATGSERELSYLAMGLVSEAGEVAGKVKKLVRDGKLDREALSKELGDVFWYLCMLSLALSKNPSKVLTENLAKLNARKERGTISGEGDDR